MEVHRVYCFISAQGSCQSQARSLQWLWGIFLFFSNVSYFSYEAGVPQHTLITAYRIHPVSMQLGSESVSGQFIHRNMEEDTAARLLLHEGPLATSVLQDRKPWNSSGCRILRNVQQKHFEWLDHLGHLFTLVSSPPNSEHILSFKENIHMCISTSINWVLYTRWKKIFLKVGVSVPLEAVLEPKTIIFYVRVDNIFIMHFIDFFRFSYMFS